MSVLVNRKREAYRRQLKDFLAEAPGGCFYSEDTFDLQRYKSACSKLLLPHESASVNLAGQPSVMEASWFWKERQLLTHLLSPINLTQTRTAFERFELLQQQVDLEGLEIGMLRKLADDAVDVPQALLLRRGDTVRIKGFDAAALPVHVGQLHAHRSLWVGVGCVAAR